MKITTTESLRTRPKRALAVGEECDVSVVSFDKEGFRDPVRLRVRAVVIGEHHEAEDVDLCSCCAIGRRFVSAGPGIHTCTEHELCSADDPRGEVILVEPDDIPTLAMKGLLA